jgi:signal transduction histidine kinase
MKRILDIVLLPRFVSEFERDYLVRMNRIGLMFFWLHLPAFVAVAYFNETGPLSAIMLTLSVLVGPSVAHLLLDRPRLVSVVHGFTAMLMGGLLVHFGQGPVQIEMHFYFFALLAMLAVYGNPMVIVVAAATVSLHHLLLWLYLPSSVFNYDAPIWVVAVHAAFVVLESVGTCFIARSFFDNVIGLEKIVRARTLALDSRNQDMRRVLDNVGQGFLTIGRDGVMSSERSAVVTEWLGAGDENATFAEYLQSVSPTTAEAFRLAWSQVIDGFMPLALTLDQMPRGFAVEDRHFRLDYRPIMGVGDDFERVLIVITDVTSEFAQQRLEVEQREVLAIFNNVMHDRAGFLEFFEEADGLVSLVANDEVEDLDVLKRVLHTLKGNSLIFGIQTIANQCHRMEDHLVDDEQRPPASDRGELTARWNRLKRDLNALLGERQHGGVEIEYAQYEAILRAVVGDTPRSELAQMISDWKLEPTAKRLARVAEQAKGIATRLQKGPLEVELLDHDLRLDPSHWSAFWAAFIHAIRNAVDHGIEYVEDRESAGKAARGRLTISTRVDGPDFVVALSDDGKGIDWGRLAEVAAARGIPCLTREELTQAIFHDGVSTSLRVSEFSGRGIGMSAVRRACEQRGGRVEVHSAAGEGTRVEFIFPREAMAAPYAAPPATWNAQPNGMQ